MGSPVSKSIKITLWLTSLGSLLECRPVVTSLSNLQKDVSMQSYVSIPLIEKSRTLKRAQNDKVQPLINDVAQLESMSMRQAPCTGLEQEYERTMQRCFHCNGDVHFARTCREGKKEAGKTSTSEKSIDQLERFRRAQDYVKITSERSS